MSVLKLGDNICKYAKILWTYVLGKRCFQDRRNSQGWVVTCVATVDSGYSMSTLWSLCWVKLYLAWVKFEDKLQKIMECCVIWIDWNFGNISRWGHQDTWGGIDNAKPMQRQCICDLPMMTRTNLIMMTRMSSGMALGRSLGKSRQDMGAKSLHLWLPNG